ncbi:MAG: methylmalonyl-CoA mutase [Candidatus Heimdallarchaeota archaeon]|nr:methylmalonyl-CoA mutase [Candidatus Heimdallarchaeota archaeon]
MKKINHDKTTSKIKIPINIEKKDFKSSYAGEFPYTSGIHQDMYRGRTWTMRQYSGFSDAKETNKRFKLLLEEGQSGLSVAFDLPTQMGYDSDDPMALGEVGKVGVAIDTVEDMKILFQDIDLSKVSTSMTINAPAMILLAMYAVTAEESGVDMKEIMGTIQNDILKEYIARGTYIFPPEPSMKLITDVFEYCYNNFPKFNTISISGYHIREAGSTAAEELAFTMLNAREYMRAAISAELSIDDIGSRVSFFFNAHNEFFEEIAKFRAARRMWANMMKDEFGAKNDKTMKLRFHTQTAGSTLTAQQIDNNIVRVTIQGMAAVLGGTQSLHTNSKDEALALPSDKSAITALRTQQIIAYESGIGATTDPLAGSFYVEYLTDEIEAKAWDIINEIEEIGVIESINQGLIQAKIHESAYEHEKYLKEKQRIVVGVNEFTTDEEIPIDLLKVSEQISKDQIDRLKKVRANRDDKMVYEILNNLANHAKRGDNIFPVVIEAVRNRASIGEICATLKEIYGKYNPLF